VAEKLNGPVGRIHCLRRSGYGVFLLYLFGFVVVLGLILSYYGTSSLEDRTELAVLWLVLYFLVSTAIVIPVTV
jgi:hypothetical protein